MSAFTREHYQTVAEVLSEARKDLAESERYARQVGLDAITDIENRLVTKFAIDNPHFKPQLFRQAAR